MTRRSSSLFALACLASLGACASSAAHNPPPAADMSAAGPQPDMTGPIAMPSPDLSTTLNPGTLPFTVDQVYISSGYMGDGQTMGAVNMIPSLPPDNKDCNGQRSSATAKGVCHQASYTPPATTPMLWAGVYWQYPSNNWGEKNGFPVPPGATQVTFYAKGSVGGEKVTFLAGGIADPAKAHQDTLKSSVDVTLTTTWTAYTISVSGQSYTDILGGFGWTMKAVDAHTGGSFFIDDIQWQ